MQQTVSKTPAAKVAYGLCSEADDEETMAVLQRSLSQRHVSDGRQEGFNALLNS